MFFKKKKMKMVAPVTGKAVAITEVEDPVFKEKVLGDGVAILPEEDDFYAPCSGKIVQIAHTYHAICIESDDGVELLIHLGMDTVELEGEGFTCYVKTGDHVNAGDKLITMDRSFVQEKGYKTDTPCIITNMDAVKNAEFLTGEVVHGETDIIVYQK